MKKIVILTMAACIATTAACTSAPQAPAADTGANSSAAVPNPPPSDPVEAASIVGSWVDDENDTYSFAADGTATGSGQVSMNGGWKADGADRYDVDLNSPVGLAKGVACVSAKPWRCASATAS